MAKPQESDPLTGWAVAALKRSALSSPAKSEQKHDSEPRSARQQFPGALLPALVVVCLLIGMGVAIYTRPPWEGLIRKDRDFAIVDLRRYIIPEMAEQSRQSRLLGRPDYDPGLLEATPEGPIPVIDINGIEPRARYAGEPAPPAPSGESGRLHIIISGLGLSQSLTEQVLQFPSAVTLGFSPYAEKLQRWMLVARAGGHETLIMLPLQPAQGSRIDAGPLQIRIADTEAQRARKLHTVMAKATGYTGLMVVHQTEFLTQAGLFAPLLELIRSRGLWLVDAQGETPAARNPRNHILTANMRILPPENRGDVEKAMNRLAERSIASEHRIIAVVDAHPLTLSVLENWLPRLTRLGITLAPTGDMLADSVARGQDRER